MKIVSDECPVTLIERKEGRFRRFNFDAAISDNYIKSRIWARIYKKECLLQSRFPVGVKIAEDTLFNVNVLCSNDNIQVIFVDEELYFYFLRESSAVHTLQHYLVVDTVPYYIDGYIMSRATKNGGYLLCQAYKSVFAFRYLARFQVDRKTLREKSRALLQLCNQYANDLSLKDRCIFGVFAKCPFLYRWYRILGDRTLLDWEKSEKKKRAERRKNPS